MPFFSKSVFSFRLWLLCLLSLPSRLLEIEQLADSTEVFLYNKTYALRIECVACEVSVVGLVVYMNAEIAIREDKVTQVEITNKRGGSISIVPIAKLTVE